MGVMAQKTDLSGFNLLCFLSFLEERLGSSIDHVYNVVALGWMQSEARNAGAWLFRAFATEDNSKYILVSISAKLLL